MKTCIVTTIQHKSLRQNYHQCWFQSSASISRHIPSQQLPYMVACVCTGFFIGEKSKTMKIYEIDLFLPDLSGIFYFCACVWYFIHLSTRIKPTSITIIPTFILLLRIIKWNDFSFYVWLVLLYFLFRSIWTDVSVSCMLSNLQHIWGEEKKVKRFRIE